MAVLAEALCSRAIAHSWTHPVHSWPDWKAVWRAVLSEEPEMRPVKKSNEMLVPLTVWMVSSVLETQKSPVLISGQQKWRSGERLY